eukprot:TRINITY_DN8705_c2_g2_i3.p1 TRINITY_DN8705_c2_g2~~TRINITY_DN8705_c2_g2_i3.p1  ORF type:complete len:108 (+),score=4.56 TRINITY_DN8705_c2_g2_i3:684-1007(+)
MSWQQLNAFNGLFYDKLMRPFTHYFLQPNQKARDGSYKSKAIMTLNYVTPPIWSLKVIKSPLFSIKPLWDDGEVHTRFATVNLNESPQSPEKSDLLFLLFIVSFVFF